MSAEDTQETIKRFTLMAVAVVFASFAVTLLFAIANGIFGGGPFVQAFLSIAPPLPGVLEGPMRAVLLLGVLMVLSVGIELYGIKTSAPFWVGLFVMAILLAEYVLPSWITGVFTFLSLGELILGVPLEELSVVRTAVLGVMFIFLYYVVVVRLQGAQSNTLGATKIDGVINRATARIVNGLLRKYQKLFVALIATVATLVTWGGIISTSAVADVVGDAPVWSGYLGTLGVWFGEHIFDVIPVTISQREFALFALIILAATAAVHFNN